MVCFILAMTVNWAFKPRTGANRASSRPAPRDLFTRKSPSNETPRIFLSTILPIFYGSLRLADNVALEEPAVPNTALERVEELEHGRAGLDEMTGQ